MRTSRPVALQADPGVRPALRPYQYHRVIHLKFAQELGWPVPDRTHAIIDRAEAARRQLCAAREGSRAYLTAERALDRAQDAIMRTVPTSDGGLVRLIAYCRREGLDEPAGPVLELVERALRRRLT